MPKQRKDKTQGPDNKKTYKYPKKKESIDSSQDMSETESMDSKKDKNREKKKRILKTRNIKNETGTNI